MNRRQFMAATAGLALSGMVGTKGLGARRAAAETGKRPPNIIVVFTDDQGYADLGVQGILDDIQTPHIDQMAREGVRFTDGYITAPQCSPSRAGLITGRYQQRFGLGHIPDTPMPRDEITIAQRLKEAGYTTGMVGKWHLDATAISHSWAEQQDVEFERRPNGHMIIPFPMRREYYPENFGFDEFFVGEMNNYWINYHLDGSDVEGEGEHFHDEAYRLELQTDAALAFINRNHDQPFFLYLNYYAPHTPLDAPEEYLERHPGDMPTRRRYGLAMMSAMDDGVGRIIDTLQEHGIDEDTLIIYTSDNGAPLRLTMVDSPIDTDHGGWCGSRNDPLVGEKGMLTDGGIRVPFVMRWKGTLPEKTVYREPISALDIAATSIAIAGLDEAPELDGTNLMPYLLGEKDGAPHEALFWRFWTQTAIRKDKWKYLTVGDRVEYLFDMSSEHHENENLIEEHPEIAAELRAELEDWAAELINPVGIPTGPLNPQEIGWYNHHCGADL